jgi:hypothetical protein
VGDDGGQADGSLAVVGGSLAPAVCSWVGACRWVATAGSWAAARGQPGGGTWVVE